MGQSAPWDNALPSACRLSDADAARLGMRRGRSAFNAEPIQWDAGLPLERRCRGAPPFLRAPGSQQMRALALSRPMMLPMDGSRDSAGHRCASHVRKVGNLGVHQSSAALQALEAPSPIQRPFQALPPWRLRCWSLIRLSSLCREQSQSQSLRSAQAPAPRDIAAAQSQLPGPAAITHLACASAKTHLQHSPSGLVLLFSRLLVDSV